MPTKNTCVAQLPAKLAPLQAAGLPSVTAPTRPTCSVPVRVIAVVGCDGSGKSTLVADLLSHVQALARVQRMYLGQSSGNIKRVIADLPLIGVPLAGYLERRASAVHATGTMASNGPTAVVIYLLSQWRLHKFRRLLRLCRRGTWVIADRFPQAEVPGFPVDGPGLAAKPARGWPADWLARRERRLYQQMANYTPALVIRLNVDPLTAHARKPDHDLSMLRNKASLMPTLHFNGAPILDLDATQPYAEVLAAACRATDRLIGMRHAAP